jgi:hypothetical protein
MFIEIREDADIPEAVIEWDMNIANIKSEIVSTQN